MTSIGSPVHGAGRDVGISVGFAGWVRPIKYLVGLCVSFFASNWVVPKLCGLIFLLFQAIGPDKLGFLNVESGPKRKKKIHR